MTARNKNIPALRFKEFDGKWEVKSGSDIFISSRKKGNDDLPIYSVTLDRGMVPRNSLDRSMLSDAKATDSLFVAKNDIAYNMMRMWQGAYGLSPENCMVSPAYVVLHPKANISSDFFIEYFARSRSLYLFTAYSYGLTSDRLRLYFKDFAQIKFNVPKFPEQQKIASFLSAIDEKIRQLTRKKELLEQYKKGVMQQLFSGKLRFKDENGKAYPKWEEKTLLEVARFRRGSFPQPYGLPKWYDDENGAPFIQVFDVDENMLLKPQTKRKISTAAQKQSVFVKKGTLVLTIQGSIGRIAKTQYDAFIDRTLLIFQDYKLPINIDFLKYVIFLLFEIEKTKAPGGTIKTITKEKLSDFEIMIPSLGEQQQIATFLSGLSTKIESVSAQIDRTKVYKKGLLQKMFV